MTPAIFNTTPFAQQCMLLMDRDGQLFFCILVCATYGFDDAGEPFALPEQVPPPLGDEPNGVPGRSSLRRASAASAAKPSIDFILNATANAPHGQAVTEMAAGVRVGDWRKVLTVTGDRQRIGLTGTRFSSPQPFVAMPLRYERAFGGSVRDAADAVSACHLENPVGVGWRGASSSDPSVASDLPNIGPLGRRMGASDTTFPVAGFGAVAPNWTPRLNHAGTYDKAWTDSRWPLPPVDLDPRFAQCAPLDQQWPHAMPHEEVQLANLTPEGLWRFRMPAPDIGVTVLHSTGAAQYRLRTDTVYVDAQARTVSVLARHCLTGLRTLGLVREIVIGDVSPGWLRAQRRGKRHVGRDAPALAD
ncbi:DUF2169 domain-containing protein [Variovorax sp. 770b2]|uniref:DUF2169 family type VI secretion system accessory protein n=1 Tax=Variovorax sp. 770b2 TaxID=1566271 RepID=UPI0008ECEC24|nr:DUF2169 domain-containing protein [Variovorax sp. 770b2]SFQ42825.1 hypothetical protein SAMN03159339_0503 [Variovorax sp. 770b2]